MNVGFPFNMRAIAVSNINRSASSFGMRWDWDCDYVLPLLDFVRWSLK